MRRNKVIDLHVYLWFIILETKKSMYNSVILEIRRRIKELEVIRKLKAKKQKSLYFCFLAL
jgi:hypothetical protein